VDRNRIVGFAEQHAVIANAEPKQSFELAAQGLDASDAGLGISVQGGQNLQGSLLLDRTNLGGNVRLKAYSLHADLIAFVVKDLIHGEAEVGDHLLEWNAFSTFVEIFERGGDRLTLFLGQLVIIGPGHDFEKFGDRRELAGLQPVEQFHDVLLIGHSPSW
jgi:hypothetical protein